MATKVLMPQLGESVTEGTISKWLVKVGDTVSKYDPLAEVTTDKVNAEVPSTVSGRVTEILIPEGETVDVGTLILYIEEAGTGAEPSEAQPAAQAHAAVAGTEQPVSAVSSPASQTVSVAVSQSQAPVSTQTDVARPKQRYSPAVMQLAQQHNIDLSQVNGSGAEGRITRKDVQAYIASGAPVRQPEQPQPSGSIVAPAQTAVPQMADVTLPAGSKPAAGNRVQAAPGDQVIPVTSVRKTIASRMQQSKHEAPHAWTTVELDVTNLVNFRNQIKDEFKQKEGVNLTYLPFFIKAVVEALKEYPLINSTWAGDSIIVKKNINISIAVATDDALYVPVIKDADQKSIYGIAKSIDDLAARTRAGKLTVDDMTGGTFTVNNTGSFGSVLSAPIINAPQAAILSVEAIVKRPVVIDDMIAIRSMTNLCMSLDHRVLDGLICGRFLQSVKQKIEGIGSETKIY